MDIKPCRSLSAWRCVREVQSLWLALRHNGTILLFLVGPIAGVFLVNAIFGMPSPLWYAAGGIFVVSISLLVYLLIEEIRKEPHRP